MNNEEFKKLAKMLDGGSQLFSGSASVNGGRSGDTIGRCNERDVDIPFVNISTPYLDKVLGVLANNGVLEGYVQKSDIDAGEDRPLELAVYNVASPTAGGSTAYDVTLEDINSRQS